MRDEFTAKNMDADGRPKLRMNAGQIIEIAHDYGCMMGPAHIFTPWTGMYKSYDTISECYLGVLTLLNWDCPVTPTLQIPLRN